MQKISIEDWTRHLPWIDRPDADIERCGSSVRREPDFDLATALHQWRERGVVVLEQAVSP